MSKTLMTGHCQGRQRVPKKYLEEFQEGSWKKVGQKKKMRLLVNINIDLVWNP